MEGTEGNREQVKRYLREDAERADHAKHHELEEDDNMENWGDGLILGAMMSGRCGGFGGWGGNCGPVVHGGHCGETLEGISRTLHSNDLRNEIRMGRIEGRLDHVAEKACEGQKQALEIFIKHQEKEACKTDQENMLLKLLLSQGKVASGGSDTNINIGNQLSALTSAVNSVLGKVS